MLTLCSRRLDLCLFEGFSFHPSCAFSAQDTFMEHSLYKMGLICLS